MRGYGNILAVSASLAVAALFVTAAWPPRSTPIFEGADYLKMAQGHYHSAYYYYAGRILHPLIVHLLVAITKISYTRAFALVAAASLITLILTCELLLLRFNSTAGWYLFPLLTSPVLIMNFRNDYFPDLLHCALCAIFFLAFEINAWISLPILTLLHMTRESSIILTIVVVVLAVAAGRRWLAVGAAAFGTIGIVISSMLVSMAIPNKHGLSTPVFDALKLLYNFVHFFGLKFSTDTNLDPGGGPPIWSIHAHLGSIHEIGFYGFDFQYPVYVILCVALAFGIMPVYLLRARPTSERLSLRIAYWYGIACLITVPLIGSWTSRYILYAWPLFWLVGPVALAAEPKRTAIAILAVSTISAWTPAAGSALLGRTWIGQLDATMMFTGWSNQLASLGLEAVIYLGASRWIHISPRAPERTASIDAQFRTAS